MLTNDEVRQIEQNIVTRQRLVDCLGTKPGFTVTAHNTRVTELSHDPSCTLYRMDHTGKLAVFLPLQGGFKFVPASALPVVVRQHFTDQDLALFGG